MHVRGPVVAFGHDRYSKLSKLEEEDRWNPSKEMSELDLERHLYLLYPRLLLLIVPIIDKAHHR